MTIHSSLFPTNQLRECARIAATIGVIALSSACASDQPGIAGPATVDGTVATEALVSPIWQEMARSLVADAKFNALAAGRAYALVSVAQYLAVQRTDAADPNLHDRG